MDFNIDPTTFKYKLPNMTPRRSKDPLMKNALKNF
jgi:hypothetical protein